MDVQLIKKYLLPLDSIKTHELDKNYPYSAVCFLLIEDSIFFIKRSFKMPTHKGEIGFVGGHVKSGESILEAYKRELFEELNTIIKPTILGTLSDTITTSHDIIVPVVCHLDMPIGDFKTIIKSNGEWDEAFCIKVSSFYNPSNWLYAHFIKYQSRDVFFYPIKAYSYESFFQVPDKDMLLWGATAHMVLNFIDLVPRDIFK